MEVRCGVRLGPMALVPAWSQPVKQGMVQQPPRRARAAVLTDQVPDRLALPMAVGLAWRPWLPAQTWVAQVWLAQL